MGYSRVRQVGPIRPSSKPAGFSQPGLLLKWAKQAQPTRFTSSN